MWFVLSVMNIVVCWRFKNGVTDDCIWSFHEVIIRINRKFINVHELVSYQFIINEILRWMIVKWPESQYSCKSILLSHNFTHLHTKSCKLKKKIKKIFNVQICNFSTFRDPLFLMKNHSLGANPILLRWQG